jgi:hypothetical protein
VSEVRGRAASFFELYCAGQVAETAIDDHVEAWHSSGDDETRPLSSYLGMTDEEYAVWVMDARTLPMLLAARQADEPVPVAVTRYLKVMRQSDDPMNRSAIQALSHWVKLHLPG